MAFGCKGQKRLTVNYSRIELEECANAGLSRKVDVLAHSMVYARILNR